MEEKLKELQALLSDMAELVHDFSDDIAQQVEAINVVVDDINEDIKSAKTKQKSCEKQGRVDIGEFAKAVNDELSKAFKDSKVQTVPLSDIIRFGKDRIRQQKLDAAIADLWSRAFFG